MTAAIRRLVRTSRARRRLRSLGEPRTPDALTEAITTATDALTVLEATSGERGGAQPDEVVEGQIALARLHRERFDLPAAIAALDRADAVARTASRHRDRHVSWTCQTLLLRGDTRRVQAQYDRAHDDLTAALHHSRTAAERAAVLDALGRLAADTGQPDEADRWYADALDAVRADPGAGSVLPDVLHDLAHLAVARGQHEVGEAHVRAAIAARPEHSPAAVVLSDEGVLAEALAGRRRDEEAEVLLLHLVQAWTRLRGADHYRVAVARHRLALLLARGDRPGAMAHLTAAATTLGRVLGEGHPETRTVLADLRTRGRRPAGTSAPR